MKFGIDRLITEPALRAPLNGRRKRALQPLSPADQELLLGGELAKGFNTQWFGQWGFPSEPGWGSWVFWD